MSINVKLGNNIINGVDVVKLQDATTEGLYHSLVEPSGNQDITTLNEYDVTNKSTARVSATERAKIIPENIKKDVSILGVTGTLENGGGSALNIEYNATTAPSDTSKLWVKTNTQPTKVSLRNWFYGDKDAVSLQSVGTLPTTYGLMSCGVVGTKCYLFGGVETNSPYYLNKIRVYDTETNTITTLSTTLANYTSGIACGVVGTKCYLFGGKTSASYLNTIQVFDTENNTINTLSTTIATACSSMGCGVIGTKIYLFGGQSSSGRLNTIQVFDTENNTINTLSTTLPTNNYGMGCGVIGTKIYLFGGRDSAFLNTIQVFDTENNTINTLSTTIATASGNMGCGVIGTKIYLFGGQSSSGRLNTIKVFDTENNTINTLSTTLPTNNYGMGCGVIGTKIYLFGGRDSAYLNTINCFIATIQLTQNELQITNNLGTNRVKIINDSAVDLEISPSGAYIGDSNGVGQVVKVAIYNQSLSQWVEIN